MAFRLRIAGAVISVTLCVLVNCAASLSALAHALSMAWVNGQARHRRKVIALRFAYEQQCDLIGIPLVVNSCLRPIVALAKYSRRLIRSSQ